MERSANPFAPPMRSGAGSAAGLGASASLLIDPKRLAQCFDREPFGFSHSLERLGCFGPRALRQLAARYAGHPRDYFVSAGAASPRTAFTAVAHGQCGIEEALELIDRRALRILFKRPENYDREFRELLETLLAQVLGLLGGVRGVRVVRREAGLFVTAAHCITPVHFDPEVAFFMQVRGEKTYHIYAPQSMSEAELERFYRRGAISIAEVNLRARDPRDEHVFQLLPGEGLHQPQNSPHWVQTGAWRSVSYSFVFETDVTRARARTRGCNYFLRHVGLRPAPPGRHPARDAAKERAMQRFLALRRRYWNIMGRIRGW